ncbi:hypothetical protein CLOSTMETH_01179 [[Clostridium] methylpentosum DSM 5476]|uniref:Uncharacterized protein n=1 Tax=[Clostridium] methylpentosum DSM 5476 TaxID=537013 RepID=C0EBG1_9FIRM|nr:hypothetical protein CLOSTMETH_01179 [[Clostridium] methylpentosum DSM 5476]
MTALCRTADQMNFQAVRSQNRQETYGKTLTGHSFCRLPLRHSKVLRSSWIPAVFGERQRVFPLCLRRQLVQSVQIQHGSRGSLIKC